MSGIQFNRVAGVNDAISAPLPNVPVTIMVMSSPTTGLRLSYVTLVILLVLVCSVSSTFVKLKDLSAKRTPLSLGSPS